MSVLHADYQIHYHMIPISTLLQAFKRSIAKVDFTESFVDLEKHFKISFVAEKVCVPCHAMKARLLQLSVTSSRAPHVPDG